MNHVPTSFETPPKIIAILPAYNAERTLERTVHDIPKNVVDDIVLVDDASQDRTWDVAKRLGLDPIRHATNRGYGGNQKTCYQEAIRRGADIVVMVHPDYQYDPTVIPELIAPLLQGKCDAVFGSRMLGERFLEGGMPLWKFYGNVFLTAFENVTFQRFFTECHSGFRAYSRRYLQTVNFGANSNNFVFDTEIIAQGVYHGLRILEIPIATRYFEEASQIGPWASLRYAGSIFLILLKFQIQRSGFMRFRIFEQRTRQDGHGSEEQKRVP